MNPRRPPPEWVAQAGAKAAALPAVVDLMPRRIARALARRLRYRYVRPRVVADGIGWAIVSPNCSRRVDPGGGEIPIAWLVPANEGRWLLHARDHEGGCWRIEATGLTLAAALERINADPLGVFWP